MKMKWIGACALAGISFLAAGCGKPSVQVMTAAKESAPFIYEAEIRPEALHSFVVAPQVSGAVISAVPDIGTAVAAGTLLFQIDASRYEAQAAMLRSQSSPSVNAALAMPAEGPEANLLAQGIITRAEYERIRSKRGAALPAAVPQEDDVARGAALQAVQQAISECTVLAPIDGVISQVYVESGKNAAAGRPALIIRQNSPVIASVEIPVEMAGLLEEAKRTKTLTVTVFEESGARVWYGELKKQLDGDDEAYALYKVQVDNPDDAIAIGDMYRVRIDSGKNIEGYVIPASAFIRPDEIEVVTADNLVDIREVTVASDLGDRKVVSGGLSDGDRVIVQPDSGLQMGMEVSVK